MKVIIYAVYVVREEDLQKKIIKFVLFVINHHCYLNQVTSRMMFNRVPNPIGHFFLKFRTICSIVTNLVVLSISYQ